MRDHASKTLLCAALAGAAATVGSAPASAGFCSWVQNALRYGRFSFEPKVLEKVQALLDAGPSQWIELGTRASGSRVFYRGLSGDAFTKDSMKSGIQEALTLLAGQPSKHKQRYVASAVRPADLAVILRDVSDYALPIVIRGRTQEFARPPNESGYTQLLDALRLDQVEAIGLFIPETRHVENWGEAVTLLYDYFAEIGIKPRPGTRGAKFFADLQRELADEDRVSQFRRPASLDQYRAAPDPK
jgi:hypothetical protein